MKRVIPVIVTMIFIAFALHFGLSESTGVGGVSNPNLLMKITSWACAGFSGLATVVMIYFLLIDIKHDR
jgi:hypothetical protein